MKVILLLGGLFLFFTTDAQLWKQYSDSAKLLLSQKKIPEGIELLVTARAELKNDSFPSYTYALMTSDLGRFSTQANQPAKAEAYFLEAMSMFEQVRGKNIAAYANCCHNLGLVYYNRSEFTKAEEWWHEAKRIRGTVYGDNHVDYASSCFNLAVLSMTIGKYAIAEQLYLQAGNVWEKHYGKEHSNYGMFTNNLGNLYKTTGEYEKAEPYFLLTREVWSKSPGKATSNYALICNNLGDLYMLMGQYERSGQLYDEAKQLRFSLFGKMNAEYATSCNNLGVLLWRQGKSAEAEQYFLEAKEIREKVGGKTHMEYAGSVNNLGLLYLSINDLKKAEDHLLEAKQIWETMFPADHPYLAQVNNNLGLLHRLKGDYAAALTFFSAAHTIRQKTLGPEHLDYYETIKDMAVTQWNLNNIQAAKDSLRTAVKGIYGIVQNVFDFTSESEKKYYLTQTDWIDRYALSLETFYNNKLSAELSYDIALMKKNLVQNASSSLRQLIENSNDSILTRKYRDWLGYREQLIASYSQPKAQRAGSIKKLNEEINKLEKELNKRSAGFKHYSTQRNISWKDVQASLKKDEIAIEFNAFRSFNGRQYSDSILYVASILRKDADRPVLVYLFEQKQLESILPAKTSREDVRANSLYNDSSLYDLICKPLEPQLTGVTKIYFSTAGHLHLLNLSAISRSPGKTFGDGYQLIRLNTTGSIVDKVEDKIINTDNIILYGGIKYATDSTSIKKAVSKYRAPDKINSVASRFFSGQPDDIVDLPESEFEVNEIVREAKEKRFTATVLKGLDANEESVKALNGKQSPSVLHFATHGFFNADPVAVKPNESLSGGKTFMLPGDPMMRSGLMFAGANNVWLGKPVKDVEDGILTGYEVSNLYLPNTRLVVLSACETGLGEIQGTEGVYGLQRAFKIAGVKNIIMSLWQIPDITTAEFMQLFYHHLFEKKSVYDAFQLAQHTMKNKYKGQPYKWAGLVLIQ